LSQLVRIAYARGRVHIFLAMDGGSDSRALSILRAVLSRILQILSPSWSTVTVQLPFSRWCGVVICVLPQVQACNDSQHRYALGSWTLFTFSSKRD
jgi:hypothetical protein